MAKDNLFGLARGKLSASVITLNIFALILITCGIYIYRTHTKNK